MKQNNAFVVEQDDEIQWYEGKAANVQFRQHEQDAQMTDAPDGYYIVNDDPQSFTTCRLQQMLKYSCKFTIVRERCRSRHSME